MNLFTNPDLLHVIEEYIHLQSLSFTTYSLMLTCNKQRNYYSVSSPFHALIIIVDSCK
jgi:hypothetical protein